ncbi:hypothetical protein PspLS_05954 [Pyricularia sp. CBS 133598]|nr:hypothetical protein PspLS_05954 [Pyricularia sp. CBS 133598]
MRSGLVFASAAIASMATPVLAGGGQRQEGLKIVGCLARKVTTDSNGKLHRGELQRVESNQAQFKHGDITITITVDSECNLKAVSHELPNVGYDVFAGHQA